VLVGALLLFICCFSADDPNSLWQLTSGFVANNPVLAAPGTVIKCNDVIRLVRRQKEHSWPLYLRVRQAGNASFPLSPPNPIA